VGWDPATHLRLRHDPKGKADLALGGSGSTAIGRGRALRDCEHNWRRRWWVEGPGSLWWIELLSAG